MTTYRLTKRAEADLAALLDYGADNFGLGQTRTFFDGLTARFSQVAENPLLYQSVDEIRMGYRRSVYENLSIYYIIEKEGVLIVRIIGR